jgi:hypothetical protein
MGPCEPNMVPTCVLNLKRSLEPRLDVYSIIQKDKKSEPLVLRIAIELKTRVGVILEFFLELWIWEWLWVRRP